MLLCIEPLILSNFKRKQNLEKSLYCFNLFNIAFKVIVYNKKGTAGIRFVLVDTVKCKTVTCGGPNDTAHCPLTI